MDPVQPVVTTSVTPVYASLGRRWLAAFIDGFLVGIVTFIIGVVGGVIMAVVTGSLGASNGANAGALAGGFAVQAVNLVLSAAYYVYFIGKSGQTLGKKAMSIKVVRKDNQQVPGFMAALLRETIGKAVSAIVLGLGYLWAIWDKDKQAWHDKIAGTIVIKA